MYEQGFAQVNNAYGFVNRNATNPYSLKVRDEFLGQARNNLKNLAAMDLSQQQNVDAAKNVFEPFVKNRPVLMDMAFTAHLDQQESIAESYRLKDGGKEFNEDNLNYLRQQRAAFANDNIDSVGSYYANRRSFTPYYDYYKEVQDKMKDFKPNTYKIDRIDGLYKMTKDDTSWREAEVSEYLNGVLSDKAKQQMRIEAQVRLGGNPEALASVYTQTAQQQMQMNKYNLDLIDKQMSTTADPIVKEQLKTKRQQIEDSNREIDTTLQTIAKGDLSFIKNNSEKLASSIYFNTKLSGFVKSFAHEEVAIKIDANQVGLALMREDRADSRQRRAFAHDEKMKAMERAQAAASLGNFQTRELAEGQDGLKLETTLKGLQNEIEVSDSAAIDVTKQIQNHVFTKIKERNPNSTYKRPEDIRQADVDKWLKTGGIGGKEVSKSDPYYTQFQPQLSAIYLQQSTAKNKLKKIEEATLKGLNETDIKAIAKTNQKIDALGTVSLDDGTTISARDFADGLRNGTVKVLSSPNVNFGSLNTFNTGVGTSIRFNINGKEVTASTTGKNSGLFNAYSQINKFVNETGAAYSKLTKNREEYMKNNFAELRLSTKIVSFDDGSPAAKSLEASAGVFLPKGYDFKHAGVGATPNNQGNAYFYITPKDDESADKIADKLTAAGAKVRVIKTDKGPAIFEIQNLENNVSRQFREFTGMEAAVVNEMQSYTGVREYVSAPFKVPNNNANFFIKKSGGLYYLHINNLGESYPTAFNTPIEAVSMARILGVKGVNMFEQEVGGSKSAPSVPGAAGSGYDYNYGYE